METSFYTFTGLPGRSNKMLISCPVKPTQTVVFFQGDVQDLRGNMKVGPDEVRQWSRWSLEDTLAILRGRFPGAAIFTVRPSVVLRDIFSCYHNFVQSSIVGAPTFDSAHNAIPHLHLLLTHCYSHISAESEQWDTPLSQEHLSALPIVLIGFSKGCVVLNQILHELRNYTVTMATPVKITVDSSLPLGLATVMAEMTEQTSTGSNEDIVGFLKRIEQIYWLDSGHSGEGGAWVTDRDVLSGLAHLGGVTVHAHTSPHMMKCPKRPWIAEEESVFVSTLRELGVEVYDKMHHKNEPRSFRNHFRILNEF